MLTPARSMARPGAVRSVAERIGVRAARPLMLVRERRWRDTTNLVGSRKASKVVRPSHECPTWIARRGPDTDRPSLVRIGASSEPKSYRRRKRVSYFVAEARRARQRADGR